MSLTFTSLYINIFKCGINLNIIYCFNARTEQQTFENILIYGMNFWNVCLQVEGLVPFRGCGLGTRERLCHTLTANLDHNVALCQRNILTALN